MEKRLILFLVLSSVIFIGWSYLYERQFPRPVEQQNEKREQAANGKEASPSTTPGPGKAETAGQSPAPAAAAPSTEVTRVDPKEITLTTDHWQARISNQGAVLTEWIMNSFTDGKPIDPPQGVVLTSPQVSREVGGPLRFYLPSDRPLEKELNTAGYQLVGDTPERLTLRQGETISLRFQYVNRGIEATKEFVFRGVAPGTGPNVASGFDFDLRATVRRQGVPVEAFLVVGPNFGDQKVTEVNIYKHAPQLTYAIGGSVERETAESLRDEGTSPLETEGLVSWAAVDDNYFAMAAIPPHTVRAFRFVDREKYVSMAVALDQAAPYRIYAGPKDLETLSTISDSLRLQDRGKGLEDIVSYGWLNFVSFLIKPIAQFMLLSLREINKLTNNFGWSIVLLTIILNMFFFPLRWKSSVTMRRAAAMQPKMKDLQDRMKKLEKNDPRMLELQKEQIALMKEGNPVMGCLPLLLQMPFFMAVFAILTVSIEVRNAPFVAWLTDLSSPDPYWVLPITMCVTMIAQQALTPTTADPIQKRIGYVMPLVFTWFLKAAPAGLVLYWMVSNLVGVAQQFVINRLNPPPPTAPAPKEEAGKGGSSKGKAKGKS
ncbi:MAG: membrane protein insertase YidC [Blastocatellia bacterium]